MSRLCWDVDVEEGSVQSGRLIDRHKSLGMSMWCTDPSSTSTSQHSRLIDTHKSLVMSRWRRGRCSRLHIDTHVCIPTPRCRYGVVVIGWMSYVAICSHIEGSLPHRGVVAIGWMSYVSIYSHIEGSLPHRGVVAT